MEVNGNNTEVVEKSLTAETVTGGEYCESSEQHAPNPEVSPSSKGGESNLSRENEIALNRAGIKCSPKDEEKLTDAVEHHKAVFEKPTDVSITPQDGKCMELRPNEKPYVVDTTGTHSDVTEKQYHGERTLTSADEPQVEGEVKSHDYRDKSDTSSLSELSDLITDSDAESEEIPKKGFQHSHPTCHGELLNKDLPPIEDLRISVPKEQCLKIGAVVSIVEELVIVHALENTPVLNLGSVLFLNHGSESLGLIFDVFGPVKEPYYSVRFNSEDHVKSRGITVGMDVFCAPKTSHTSFVFVSEMLKMKGSDASWEHNNEPPLPCLDYSDDEQERHARKRLTAQRRVAHKDGVTSKRNDSGPNDDGPRSSEESGGHQVEPSNFAMRGEPDGQGNPPPFAGGKLRKVPLLPSPNASQMPPFHSMSPDCIIQPPKYGSIIPPDTPQYVQHMPPSRSPYILHPPSSYPESYHFSPPIHNHPIPLNANPPPMMFPPPGFQHRFGSPPHASFGPLPFPGHALNVRNPLLPTPNFHPPLLHPAMGLRPPILSTLPHAAHTPAGPSRTPPIQICRIRKTYVPSRGRGLQTARPPFALQPSKFDEVRPGNGPDTSRPS